MLELLCLPIELLEQVFLAQEDIKDMISFAFTCSRMHKILSQPRMWRNILGKVMKDNNPTITVNLRFEIEMLMKFLKTVGEHYKTINIILLHETICEIYPGSIALEAETMEEDEEEEKVWSRVTVICSLSSQPHHVSVLGLQLLSLTEGESDGHNVQVIKLGQPAFLQEILACLGSSRPRLEVEGTTCYITEKEGRRLGDFLERCSSWRLGMLVLEIGVGDGTWQRLARAAAKGRLEILWTGRKVVGRGRLEEVRRLWEKTEGSWVVGGEVQQGWQSIQNIHKSRRRECCWNNQFLLHAWQTAVEFFLLCLPYVGWEISNPVLRCILSYNFHLFNCLILVHLISKFICLKTHQVSCYLAPQCHSAFCLLLVRLLG